MSYTPTTWEARIGTGLNKFTASGAVTGDVTLTPNPTAITQEGTAFTAARMNNIEQGIVALSNSTRLDLTWTCSTSTVFVTSLYALYCGKVVEICGVVGNTASVAARSLIASLSLTNISSLIPGITVTAPTIKSGYDILAQITPDGNINLYNRYTSAGTFSNGIDFGIIYLQP